MNVAFHLPPPDRMLTSNMRVQRSTPLNRLPEPQPNKTLFQTPCYALGKYAMCVRFRNFVNSRRSLTLNNLLKPTGKKGRLKVKLIAPKILYTAGQVQARIVLPNGSRWSELSLHFYLLDAPLDTTNASLSITFDYKK